MPSRSVDVFFYGLFMGEELVRGKGLTPQRPELASVDGFTLRIGQRAALVPKPGGQVHGVLVSLTLAELDRLYAEPSVQQYEPQAVLVNLATGDLVAALCYNLVEPPSPAERNPEYASRLRAIARKVGLPPDNVASLQ